MEATKDVELGTNRYQITRFTPRVGNWLVSQFLTKNLLLNIEQPDQEVTEKDLAAGLAVTMQQFQEETFNKVQAYALEVCRRYGPADTVLPLFMKDGRAAVEPVPSPVELLILTATSLAFNLHCFFESGARDLLLTIFPDLSSSHPLTRGSAATSSGQS